MKIAKTFDEFLVAYKADNELPMMDLKDDADEALANVLCQIYLGIFDDSSHYIALTRIMVDRWLSKNNDDGNTFINVQPKITEARNRIVRICMGIDMKVNEDMLCYYCSKTCEELGIGDMVAGGDEADDIFVGFLYKITKNKLQMHNLWSYEQRISVMPSIIDR